MARLYLARGWRVVGTYREAASLGDLRALGANLLPCDVSKPEDIDAVAQMMVERDLEWDLFVGAVGQLSPIGPFFETDRRQWHEAVNLNGGCQLELLHAIHARRRARPLARVVFLVGGAINRAFANYSSYSLGKLNLVKFCELIHDECSDLHAVAVGTGWVATKIHRQTVAADRNAGENLEHTREFLARGEPGTSIDDIVACIDWCFDQHRDVTGGRNFSVVHDPWRNGGVELVEVLRLEKEKFKLRRYLNTQTEVALPS